MKDVIIRAGQHLHPQVIEQAVGEVPGIRRGRVAAFGTHSQGTERLVVVAETRATDPAQRQALQRDMLAEPAEDPAPLDSQDVDALRERENEYEDAAVLQELRTAIDDLPEDQQIDLVALTWLGRDNCSASDWPAIRQEAAEAHNARTADYLLGMSMASGFLEEGLSTLGFSDERADPEPPQQGGNAS